MTTDPNEIPEAQYAVSTDDAAVVLLAAVNVAKTNPVPTIITAAALGYIAALAGTEWYNTERVKAIMFLQEYAQTVAKVGGEIAKRHLGAEFQRRRAAQEAKQLEETKTFFGARPGVPEV